MNGPEMATDSRVRQPRTFHRSPLEAQRSGLPWEDAANAPLTRAQKWVWSLQHAAPELSLCNRTLALHHSGQLCLDAVQRAIREIIQRHEAWRTKIGTENGDVKQIVCSSADFTMAMTDLQELPDAERKVKVQSLVAEEARRPIPVDTAPMMRCRLLKLQPEQHVLVVTVHELISDSVSLCLFLQELIAHYEAFAAGRPATLSALPVQYGDYLFWESTQANARRSSAFSAQELADKADAVAFPTDFAQTGAPSFRGNRHAVRFRKELCDALARASQQQRATLQAAFMAAFHILIARYADQDEIVIGSLAHTRNATAFQQVLGRFAAPLTLHTDLSGNPTFSEVLRRVRESEAEGHEDFFTSGQSQDVRSEPQATNRPPFRLLFSFEPDRPILPPEWNVLEFNADAGFSAHDLCLTLESCPEGVAGNITYKTDLFEPATISRMAGHLQMLLEGITSNPELRISQLPMLTEEERHQIVSVWNDTFVPYSPDICLHEFFEASARNSPDAVAVISASGQFTYAELNRHANQVARVLQQNGIGPEIPVPVCLERSLDMAVAVLGILKAGGACVLLDPAYPPERLAFMLEDLQAPVLITRPGLLPSTAIGHAKVLDVSSILKTAPPAANNVISRVTPRNLAFVIYTSGSTGKPKGALLPHRALAHYNLMTAKQYAMGPGDRYLQFSSPSFDVAVEEIFATWISGATLVLRSQETSFSLTAFLEEVECLEVSVVNLPAAFWHEWVHEMSELEMPIPKCMRVVVVGGEKPFHASLLKWLKFARPQGVRWINAYGPTEASISSATFEPDLNHPPDSLVPIGRALPNTKLYILDRYLNVVPIGVPGELHIGGMGLARGYLNRPEITKEKFIPDPFSIDPGARLYKSGDIARYLPTGEIDCLGRKDHQVKLRGFRIELGEIEEVLSAHPEVVEAAVIVRQAETGDKKLVAFIVPAESNKFEAAEIRSYIRQKLPEYMVPSEFVTLTAMPLTTAGKVDRRRLPLTIPKSITSTSSSLPTDALEAKLVKIWEEVLDTQPIGTDRNFFELGGHSLLAARLIYRIGQALGQRLPIALLFQAPTIASFAAVLRQKEWKPSWSSLVPMQPLGSRPPFFCVHGVGGNIIGFNALAARMQPEQPFYGLQAQGLNGANPCHASVEEMAAHYIAEIRKVQPRGPYYIGGFSFGGLVAYEMARQLTAQDEGVGSLLLFDTYTAKLTSKTVSLANILLSDHRKELLAKLPAALKKSLKRRLGSWQIPSHLKRVRDACSQAAADYVLKPYSGRVTLFCAREKSLRSSNGMYSGWALLAAGGVEVHDIAGDHGGMLREPQVAALAARLKSCLEGAQSSDADELRSQAV